MNILIATDGSDSANAAVELVTRFPFPQHSALTAITVVDTKLFTDSRSEGLDEAQSRQLEQSEQAIHADADRMLAQVATRLRAAGRVCSTEVHAGNPAEQILEAAGRLKPDLIVVGAHGVSGLRHFRLGSVADKVLEHAECSVLIVRTSAALEDQNPWNILVAYDDSGPAREAVRFSASLPLAASTQVTVVTVMPMIHMYRQDIRQELNSIWQQKRDAAQRALDDAVAAVRWPTSNVSSLFRESADVARDILDAAAETRCDLVVLGYKGRSAIKRFLLGSVTARIAHHAPCSVLAVRSPQAAASHA
jgi:nucleotide-binding universal stress UspA family protein